ncbi:BTB-domain-containing protein [Rhizophagus irregularis]|uniref:BTB-domain-containing protein n=1 Tax=Rhizophagus irregularis TaxID=588596 RepID=A0A2N0RTT6_9GLOM|nr:BTB-domain-containing protein [Rhizophagus irregularis]
MTSFFYPNLSKDFSLILNDADDYNVIIKVGENENTKEFRAHSVILRARSPYFKSALSSNWITKKNDMIMFKKTNITPNIFNLILRYIYVGELDLTGQSSKDILELLIASDELLIGELFNYVQDYLIEKRIEWILKNLFLVLHIAFKITDCKKLQDYCIDIICEDTHSFITSNEFLSLDKDIIYKILERDDLRIKEVIVWDRLIKWGIEQTPGLGNENCYVNLHHLIKCGIEQTPVSENEMCDISKWSNEDYEALKEILNQFILLVRFVEITSDDFNNKVKPYKGIIPNQIYEEIEEFYNKGTFPKINTLPPRIGKLDSKIINPKLAKIIIKWIVKEDFWILRYKFNLMYRGSIDGISYETFKNKCKGQMESLVLIKVKHTNKIFGGYSSIGFNSIGNNVPSLNGFDNTKYYYSSDNFIFSFENDDDTQNMKISRVRNYNKAIYDYYGTGFDFGFDSLFMYHNQCLYAKNDSKIYEDNLNTNSVYEIEEIETFIVTKQ